jgi:predicted GNAT family acetyltransferase
MSTTTLERFPNARAFQAAVTPALKAAEIENGLFLGITHGMATHETAGQFLALTDDTGVRAAALRSPPHEVVLSRAEYGEVKDLADAWLAVDRAAPGVVGRADLAEAFARRWSVRTGQVTSLNHQLILYALRAVVPPARPVPGALRVASEDDLPWLVDWMTVFSHEAKLVPLEREPAFIAKVTRARVAASLQFIWFDGERPCAAVGYARGGVNGARIQHVYTPAEERRRGYASAAVHALVTQLLGAGRTWCGLFADIENPQSNRIYRRLGFTQRAYFKSIAFR